MSKKCSLMTKAEGYMQGEAGIDRVSNSRPIEDVTAFATRLICDLSD